MSSGDLLALINRAIAEKQNARKNYEKYFEQMTNPTLKKVVEGVLQREAEHLEVLNSLKNSLNSNGNLENAAIIAEGLFKNTKNHEQHMELMKIAMQGTVGSFSDEEKAETEVVNSEVPVVAAEAANKTVAKSRPPMNYSRGSYTNRSVVNCSFGGTKTVFKK